MAKLTRFRDVPKIAHANYRVDQPLAYLPMALEERYIGDMGLELEPDFQRGHVWTEEQQVAFVEHLLREGMSGRDVYLNHTHWRTMEPGWFVLVDGLQRITACRRFLSDGIPAFGSLYSEYEDRPSHGISLRFHVNDLPTRAAVLQWYIDLNAGGVVHSEDEIARVRALLEQET